MAFAINGPFAIYLALLFVYGITNFTNTEMLLACIIMHTEAESRGNALALFLLYGFGGDIKGSVDIGFLIETFGGRETGDI